MTTATTPALACTGLTKFYDGNRVLDGLDLTVRPGRVYALLGRNGAGKSTTFKIILGLLHADAGTVEVLGQPWTRGSLAHIGASVDGPAYYPHLSAADNVRVHARLVGTTDGRIDDVVSMVGLQGTGRKRVASFSTGMKARLALAIALLTDPPILLLDEPQNGLDPEGIIELRRLIRELAARGRTVIISSHQLGEVTHLADDIGVLVSGRMVYEGALTDFSDGDLEQAYLRATGAVA
ncbi:ATP-binding cassette domain-containing protein [Luteococcus sp.]|uniref:ATP-binding cassette domain-containing protein n=1 Tax=Luteococcus sp. TaxID=1969402 RepID=UPI003735E0CB